MVKARKGTNSEWRLHHEAWPIAWQVSGKKPQILTALTKLSKQKKETPGSGAILAIFCWEAVSGKLFFFSLFWNLILSFCPCAELPTFEWNRNLWLDVYMGKAHGNFECMERSWQFLSEFYRPLGVNIFYKQFSHSALTDKGSILWDNKFIQIKKNAIYRWTKESIG